MSDREPAVQTEPMVRMLFTAEQIAARVREMGLELARDYAGERPVYVGVLKGACVFQVDLARATTARRRAGFRVGGVLSGHDVVRERDPDPGPAAQRLRAPRGPVRGRGGIPG
jgi:hypothetical protein